MAVIMMIAGARRAIAERVMVRSGMVATGETKPTAMRTAAMGTTAAGIAVPTAVAKSRTEITPLIRVGTGTARSVGPRRQRGPHSRSSAGILGRYGSRPAGGRAGAEAVALQRRRRAERTGSRTNRIRQGSSAGRSRSIAQQRRRQATARVSVPRSRSPGSKGERTSQGTIAAARTQPVIRDGRRRSHAGTQAVRAADIRLFHRDGRRAQRWSRLVGRRSLIDRRTIIGPAEIATGRRSRRIPR